MKNIKLFFSPLLLAATLPLSAVPLRGAEGIISKVVAMGNYCHLKFPAIREETLHWDRPILKDRSDGDIIDFYGPCDYDPLGKVEIQRQRQDLRRRLTRDAED